MEIIVGVAVIATWSFSNKRKQANMKRYDYVHLTQVHDEKENEFELEMSCIFIIIIIVIIQLLFTISFVFFLLFRFTTRRIRNSGLRCPGYLLLLLLLLVFSYCLLFLLYSFYYSGSRREGKWIRAWDALDIYNNNNNYHYSAIVYYFFCIPFIIQVHGEKDKEFELEMSWIFIIW